eukprot:m.48478 g.48478  ORF g.48478 m.48478 type:complete len:337 (+) comp6037_c0_seq1:77-1087(+)
MASLFEYVPPLAEDADARDRRLVQEQQQREREAYAQLQHDMNSSRVANPAPVFASDAAAASSECTGAESSTSSKHSDVCAAPTDAAMAPPYTLSASAPVAAQQSEYIAHQQDHPLGLLAASLPHLGLPPACAAPLPSASATISPAPLDDAPPAYADVTRGSAADFFCEKAPIAYTALSRDPASSIPRCASCFDAIAPGAVAGMCGAGCVFNGASYHIECFERRVGPRCNHCAFTLTSHPDEGLSGLWGHAGAHSYHVECYQTEAGPRCTECFDVIFANPARGLSGQWRRVGGRLMHDECFRRLYPTFVDRPDTHQPCVHDKSSSVKDTCSSKKPLL